MALGLKKKLVKMALFLNIKNKKKNCIYNLNQFPKFFQTRSRIRSKTSTPNFHYLSRRFNSPVNTTSGGPPYVSVLVARFLFPPDTYTDKKNTYTDERRRH